MSAQKAKSKPKYAPFVKTALRQAINGAQDLYSDPKTSMIPKLSEWTQRGLQSQVDLASGGGGIEGVGLDEARNILSGNRLDVTNDPRFQRNIQSAMGMASERFAGSGRVGSGSYAGALGDAATGVAAQLYGDERNRQMDLISQLPQLIQSQYSPAMALQGAGDVVDAQNMAEFDWPYARIDRFANTIYGNPVAQTPGQTSSKKFDWLSAVGGMVPKIQGK